MPLARSISWSIMRASLCLDPLQTLPAEKWDETMAVNLRAPYLLAQALVGKMMEQHAGKIINVSSQAGVVALEVHGAYCASKGGLNMLTKVMALEWGPHNIQVNAVCPTVILTPMGTKVWGDPLKADPMLAKIPLGRFGQPVEVADLILFLASRGVRPDHGRGDPDRRRLHGHLAMQQSKTSQQECSLHAVNGDEKANQRCRKHLYTSSWKGWRLRTHS